MHCAISEFRECAMQSRDCANSQIAWNIYNYMKIPPFDLLVWGSLRLAPIITVTFPRQHSMNHAGKCCSVWEMLLDVTSSNYCHTQYRLLCIIQVQRFGWLPITIWHANNSYIPQTEQHEPTQKANAVPCGKCSLIICWILIPLPPPLTHFNHVQVQIFGC